MPFTLYLAHSHVQGNVQGKFSKLVQNTSVLCIKPLFLGSSRKSGAWILRKVLNLWHENRRCNMDVPARGHGRAI